MARSVDQQVLSKQREADCVTLRCKGHTYEVIAKKLGYANRSSAKKAYLRGLERIGRETAEEALVLQYERLNALLFAIWPEVNKGSHAAIDQALKIMDRIHDLFGFDQRQPPPQPEPNPYPDAVMVIPGRPR